MSGRIPREFIHQLLNRTDIVELIDSRIPLKKKSGNNYFACCPFHDEKSASFSVSHAKQFYHCFGCGQHGNAIDFLIAYDRLSFPAAVESLAGLAGLPMPENSPHEKKNPAADPDRLALLNKAGAFYRDALRRAPEAIAYLKQRGITGETAQLFGLGFAPPGWETLTEALGTTAALREQLTETGMLIRRDDGRYHDRFRKRIMFPIHDRRGRIVGFGGRVLDKDEPKYLNSPETPFFHKGRELYGLHHVLKTHRDIRRIVIVEGYTDVIMLFQHGVTCAVATLGTATTASHLETLFRHTPEIIFCFDGDKAGRAAATRALQIALPHMEDGRQIRFLFLPEGEDPDTLVRKTGAGPFLQQLAEAIPLSQFFFQSIAAMADLGSLDGRARFATLAIEQLQRVPEGIFRKMMQDELAKRAHTDLPSPTPGTPVRAVAAGRKSFTPSSPLRLAITLLVQEPSLARLIDTALPPLDQPGAELLNALFACLEAHPALSTTGELLEHWRDREDAPVLAKLACLELAVPKEGMEAEFLGAINRLRQLSHEQAITRLLNKAKAAPLTGEEKALLNELISSK